MKQLAGYWVSLKFAWTIIEIRPGAGTIGSSG
jgi:hypothetical protein